MYSDLVMSNPSHVTPSFFEFIFSLQEGVNQTRKSQKGFVSMGFRSRVMTASRHFLSVFRGMYWKIKKYKFIPTIDAVFQ